MNIFLTGGSGFVGSHLLEKLLLNNHKVFVLVRNPKKLFTQNHSNLVIVNGDLDHFNLTDDELNSIDLLIHTAGIVHSFTPTEFYQVNTEGSKKLFQRFFQVPHLKVIFISSLAAHGPHHEDQNDLPVSHYGKSKLLAEKFLLEECPSTWSKITHRPPMVIGPRDTAMLDVFKMVKDGFVLLPGLGSLHKKYSFVSVFDLVENIYQSINVDHGLIYPHFPNVILFSDIFKTIENKMSKKAKYLPVPKFIIFIFAHLLNLIFKIRPHALRMTPDKINELFPASWICPESTIKLQANWNLEKTIEVTLTDYQKRHWL